MSILWCGGEDIDFPNGNAVAAFTNSGFFRSGYARCGVHGNTSGGLGAWSLPFSGGAITSAWVSAYVQYNNSGQNSIRFVGLVNSASGNNSGVWFGNGVSGTNPDRRVALLTYNGTTLTQLAMGSSDIFTGGMILARIDMQLTNYGSSSTVNIYVNGTLYLTYSGSTAVSGISSLDTVGLYCNGGNSCVASEIIVSTTDTRAMSLLTMAPNGAGTTDSWTGTYTSVNPVAINDANSVYTNTATQDEQFTLIGTPAGAFSVQAVKIAARASYTSGAAVSNIALGVNSGGTVNPGSPQALANAYTTYERLMATNPVSSAAWTASDLNALQSNFRSS